MTAPNLQKLISTYLASVQETETEANNVYRCRFIDEAEGTNLDGLGALVGCLRLGLNDAEYRIAIRTQIKVNASSGTNDDILDIFRAALGNSYTVEITAEGAAAFEAILRPEIAEWQVPHMEALLQAAKAAGVYAYLNTTTSATTFRFAGGSGAARGFGVGSFASAG